MERRERVANRTAPPRQQREEGTPPPRRTQQTQALSACPSLIPSLMSQCAATTRAGKRCRAGALAGSNPPRCFNHDGRPETVTARRIRNVLGGVRRQQGASAPPAQDSEIPPADLKTIDGGVAALERIYESLRHSPSSRALQRARALTAVVSEAIRAHRDHSIEARLNALEEKHGAP